IVSPEAWTILAEDPKTLDARVDETLLDSIIRTDENLLTSPIRVDEVADMITEEHDREKG
ncbi:hypothetical protein S245_012504, partial [Arachis hypogaea]